MTNGTHFTHIPPPFPPPGRPPPLGFSVKPTPPPRRKGGGRGRGVGGGGGAEAPFTAKTSPFFSENAFNANRAIRIAVQRTQGLRGPVSVFRGRYDRQRTLVIRIAAITLASDSAITLERFRPSKLSSDSLIYYHSFRHHYMFNLKTITSCGYLMVFVANFG